MKLLFSLLQPGLNRGMRIVLDEKPLKYKGMTFSHEAFHEIIYVNAEKREVLLKIGSAYKVMSEKEFDEVGYEDGRFR